MRLEQTTMFSFLKKTSEKTTLSSSNKINGERSHNQANQESISQKLDKTAKLLDTKTQSNKTSKKNKDDLIKHALEVQKSQSKLLDNLDEKTCIASSIPSSVRGNILPLTSRFITRMEGVKFHASSCTGFNQIHLS